MPCDTEIYAEKAEGTTWTDAEIEALEAATALAIAKVQNETMASAEAYGWNQEQYDAVLAERIEESKRRAHEEAHDRHFLRQVNQSVEARREEAHALPDMK